MFLKYYLRALFFLDAISHKKRAAGMTAWIILLPSVTYASFIESTIGTAVVNDSTASYFNPAALVQLKNTQVIPQVTVAVFRSSFSGQSVAQINGVTDSGTDHSRTNFYSPTFFFGMPIKNKMVIGLAVVTNSANRNTEDSAVLRYVEASNNVQDYDVVPAFALKINDYFSIGGGINLSYANFDLKPITGFPGSNMADSQSHNQSNGSGVGGNAGFLFKPNARTVIGFNYRSMTTYNLSGTSVLGSNPRLISNNYHFKLRTPARMVFSLNHFVTQKLGFITTLQRIQWSDTSNVNVYGIATVVGATPIITNGSVSHYLRNTWLVTFGTHYKINPKWILRVAGTYTQSPGNPYHQVVNGDSIVLGASTGYEINKTVTLDGSYAHAFVKSQNINVKGVRYLINGVTQASRDAMTLKLTLNL